MCLSIPAKVISVEGLKALVTLGGAEYNAALDLVENVKPGDYVLLHCGFAIQVIDEYEANETLRLLGEIIESEEDETHR